MNALAIPPSVRAREIIESSFVWDNHGCMPMRPLDESFLPQLWRYRQSGIDHVSLNIGFGELGIEHHLRMAASFRRWLALDPERFVLVRSLADLELAKATGRLAVSFDIEGASAVGDQLSLVQLYYDLGVRWMSLAYNLNSPAGGGCQDDDQGLTSFGRDLLDEMARVGMVVCLSHVGKRTAEEVLERASRPVVFSHSNPIALRSHPRNISDGLMKSCAATGGVVGINGVGPFLGDNDIRSETFVRHVDYVLQLIGPEHVALGLDYVFDRDEVEEGLASMADTFPAALYANGMDFVRPEQLAEIVDGLLRAGCTEDQLKSLLGGNLIRVAERCWLPPH